MGMGRYASGTLHTWLAPSCWISACRSFALLGRRLSNLSS
jgi:hypothetical protein